MIPNPSNYTGTTDGTGGTGWYPYVVPNTTDTLVLKSYSEPKECRECIHSPVCKYKGQYSDTRIQEWVIGCKHYYMDPKVMAEKL